MSLLSSFEAIDWGSYEKSCEQSQRFLLAMAEQKSFLRHLCESVEQTSSLREKCERYDLLTKIVLHESNNGARLRLHIFHEGYFDRPHNHRWPYSSNILSGKYIHRLYLSKRSVSETTLADLIPVLDETRGPGQPYSLNTGIFHSVTSLGPTITLITRGPATERSFRVLDRKEGTAWTQVGAADESPAERKSKELTNDQFQKSLSLLESAGVI